MECPKCGYVLAPFDKTCPRCANMPKDPAPTRTVVAPPPESTPPPTAPPRPKYYDPPKMDCPTCGQVVSAQARACPGCGHPFRQWDPVPPGNIRGDVGRHSAVVAVLLSLFCLFVGGQLYNRQYVKAFVMALVLIIGGIFTYGILSLLLALALVIDAGVVAGRLNRGETISQWQFF